MKFLSEVLNAILLMTCFLKLIVAQLFNFLLLGRLAHCLIKY